MIIRLSNGDIDTVGHSFIEVEGSIVQIVFITHTEGIDCKTLRNAINVYKEIQIVLQHGKDGTLSYRGCDYKKLSYIHVITANHTSTLKQGKQDPTESYMA